MKKVLAGFLSKGLGAVLAAVIVLLVTWSLVDAVIYTDALGNLRRPDDILDVKIEWTPDPLKYKIIDKREYSGRIAEPIRPAHSVISTSKFDSAPAQALPTPTNR